MSWSVQAVGKAPAVALKIESDFTAMSKCMEPEEGVKQAVRAAISVALAAQDPKTAVKVSASGSQSTNYPDNTFRNQLSVSVEPMYGFVE